MQTEGALLRLPPPHLLARPSPPRAELGAEGTGADPQGHYSTTTPVPAISSSSQGQDLWGPSHHPLQEGRAPPHGTSWLLRTKGGEGEKLPVGAALLFQRLQHCPPPLLPGELGLRQEERQLRQMGAGGGERTWGRREGLQPVVLSSSNAGYSTAA